MSSKLQLASKCRSGRAFCDHFQRLGLRILAWSSTDGVLRGNHHGHQQRMSLTRAIMTKSSYNIIGEEIIIKSGRNELQRIQNGDLLRKMDGAEEYLANNPLSTVIVFDVGTTGLSREHDRIIEIGLQDLSGGENSTFQTCVNPERCMNNNRVHGILTRDLPRMKGLIPDLVQYVESRQKTSGGKVLLVAHNARNFDVPFLIKEFGRCAFDFPEDWMFLCSLSLARERKKLGGSMQFWQQLTLQALRKYYEIPLLGPPHRALSDVFMLSLILERLMVDQKLQLSGLVDRSFTASELMTETKKKKNKSRG